MKISAYQTALLVALMFNRSGFKRARLTSKTLCVISGRTNLRSHFIVQLQAELDDLGLILFDSLFVVEWGDGVVGVKSYCR